MDKDNQLIKTNYCNKCLGYGVYYIEECCYDRRSIYPDEIISHKFKCEDCNGSGKNLIQSNGYPKSKVEI